MRDSTTRSGATSTCARAGTPSRPARRRSCAASWPSASSVCPGPGSGGSVDVTLSDDQKELQASARRLFSERLPAERLVELADAADAADAVDAKLWDEVVRLGWADITAQGG